MQYTWTENVNTAADGSIVHVVTMPDATITMLENLEIARFPLLDKTKLAAAHAFAADASFPPWLAKYVDPATQAQLNATYDAHQTTPRYMNPGDAPIVDNKGGVLTIRPTDGAVFRNGIRLGTVAAQRALIYGDGLYMKGRTDAAWWAWNGSSWSKLTAELDPTLFI